MSTFKLATIALTAWAFVACNGNAEEPDTTTTRTAVQVTNARIVGSTPANTRATDNAWESGDAIGLVMFQTGTATLVDGKAALKHTTATAAGSFQPADESHTGYYPSEGKGVDILAFYPYAQIGTDLMVPVNTADQSTLGRIDLMVADKSTGHSESKPGVDLTFSHKLAQVVITVTKDASAADLDLTGATLKLVGTATTAKWSLAEARLIDFGADTDISLVATTTKETLNATAIALPTAAGKTVQLALTFANGEVFTLRAQDAFALVAGMQNKLTLAVKKTNLTLTGISVEPWQTVDEGEVGTQPGIVQADGTQPLDPALFGTVRTTWIVTGGGTTEADAIVLKNVRDALNALPPTTNNIDLVLPDVKEVIFLNNTPLRSISAPQATSIMVDAFRGCTALTTVSLPAAKKIMSGAFDGCTALTTISLPQATSIGLDAFNDCKKLTNISLPQATSIIANAFTNCKALITLSLPQATSIGEYVFIGCEKLTNISLPVAKSIGETAFGGCEKLTNISLPVAESIGKSAFSNCAALTAITLPAAKSIGETAFIGCSTLTRLELPAAGDFTLDTRALDNFETSACKLVLNPDKKTTGTATPKVAADGTWGPDGYTRQWKSIAYAAPAQ